MRTLAIAALAAAAGSANADILISEILGSTGGSDLEFIELVNTGAAPVDISGWSVELWDSDFASLGSSDGASPYFVPGGTTLAPGAVFTFSNALSDAGFGIIPDAALPANAVENSSYTAVLADAGSSLIDAVFVSDGDVDDIANRGGSAISALTVGPDGSFLPAGFARTDVSGGFAILEFSNDNRGSFTLESGTPGVNQIPAPATAALLGLGGLAAARRRR